LDSLDSSSTLTKVETGREARLAVNAVTDETNAMKRSGTEVYSIFGQIEEVAADLLIEKGKANRIAAQDIPSTAMVNDMGQVAKFAIVVPREHIREFEETIRKLRA
jgi:hypothetical protein